MASPYRILTFDVVGTLIDFEQGIFDCLHSQLKGIPNGTDDQDCWRPTRAPRTSSSS